MPSTTSIFSKFPPGHDFGGKKVLNVGCGFAQYKRPNVINLDAFPICKPDVVHDLNTVPLPFDDEQFDIIIANHILEHIPNWWECFNDLTRVLKTNGQLIIWVPAIGTDAQWGFRDHVAEINPCSFFGVYGTWREGGNAWADETAACRANRLKMVGMSSTCAGEWWIKHAPAWLKAWMRKHLRNTMIEDGYIFRKVTMQEHMEERNRYADRNPRVGRDHAVSVL